MERPQRIEIHFESRQFRRLEGIARQQGVPLAELIRRTVLECYPPANPKSQQALEEICNLQIPLGDWKSLEEEIDHAHGALS
jgi:hypothetical protein